MRRGPRAVVLGTLLFDVKAVDPTVFAAMSVTMIGIGILASYMPARRASSVDPIESLRTCWSGIR